MGKSELRNPYTYMWKSVCVFDLREERREKKYSKRLFLRGCEYALKYYEAFVRVYITS